MAARPDLDTLERLLAGATPLPWDSARHAKLRTTDIALVRAAVNALPALLAEVETLREALVVSHAEKHGRMFSACEEGKCPDVRTDA